MRGFYPYLLLIFAIVLSSCSKNYSYLPILLDQSNLNLSECSDYPNSSVDITPSLQLKASKNGNLHISFYNAEFCCGTDSVIIKNSTSQTSLQLELEDNGPYTYCVCPRIVDFTISNLINQIYQLQLIEAQYAYSRDTFNINFTYTPDLDTTIIGGDLILEY